MGYTTIELKSGYNLLTANFKAVNGQDTIDIQDLLKGTFVDGDSIKFWSPTNGYEDYYYYSATLSEDQNEILAAGWADGNIVRAKRAVQPGEAFWFIPNGEGKTVTVSGAIQTANQTIVCDKGLNFKGIAFPVDVKLNEGNFSVTNLTDGDYIKVYYPGEGYRDYYYYSATLSEDQNEILAAGWTDGNIVRVNDSIPAGFGFWIYAQNTNAPVTISITSPVK